MSNEYPLTVGNGNAVPAPAPPSAMTAVEEARAVQEVQAALVIAKRFPRDEVAALDRIVEACQRPALAERAMYSYPRGGTRVTGPSIRLAETLARFWGNLSYGIREIDRKQGASTMEAFCWDQETNVRASRIFEVRHVRHTKKGAYDLTDERDIYEMNANQGARRLRAAILEIIPGYVVDEAIAACERTLAGASDEPLADRALKLVQAFKPLGVTKEMIEQRLGHKLTALIEAELVDLRSIYNSIKDGMSKREDWFEVTAAATQEQAEALKDKLGRARNRQQSKKPKATESPADPGADPADLPLSEGGGAA